MNSQLTVSRNETGRKVGSSLMIRTSTHIDLLHVKKHSL